MKHRREQIRIKLLGLSAGNSVKMDAATIGYYLLCAAAAVMIFLALP